MSVPALGRRIPPQGTEHELPLPYSSTKSIQLNGRDTVNVTIGRFLTIKCHEPSEDSYWGADMADIRRITDKLKEKDGVVAPPVIPGPAQSCEWRWVAPSCFGDQHERQSLMMLCNEVSPYVLTYLGQPGTCSSFVTLTFP